MIKYKIDVLNVLKEKGITTYTLRTEKLIGESTIQAFRKGDCSQYKTLDTLCRLLKCDVGDIIEYIPDSPENP